MSTQEIVESAIKQHKVVIFSKTTCPYSDSAKALFAAEFSDVDALVVELDEREDGAAIQKYLHTKTGQRTVPNIFINQTHIGGNDKLQSSFRAGKLVTLVSA